MIKEHDRVVLRKSIPGQGLKTGDVGTVIIHVYEKGEVFEVEFLTLHGETVASQSTVGAIRESKYST
jgi:Domain of unknown function (DUF4926)